MGKQLTPELIIQRTKTDKFDAIKNLNLWGNDLDDVNVIQHLPNLEVLSLSVNKISTLKSFQLCPKLTELYLRKNNIADLSEIQFLTSLKQLRVLWLWDNPCSEQPNYRLIVIKAIPHLTKLDNTMITNEEREAAAGINLEDAFSAMPPAAPKEATPAAPAVEKPQKEPEVKRKVERPIKPASVDTENRPPSPTPPHPQPAIVEPRQKNSGPVKRSPPRNVKPVEHAPQPMVEPDNESKNENILCAVLALIKELDTRSLELVRKNIDRVLGKK